jgi:RimJ/RimL family protein N-acetyltransferase
MTTDISNLRLVTPRLVLREFTFDDLDAVYAWVDD